MLVAGLPPAKLHAYDATLPSGSTPEPANEIELPGFMTMLDDGLAMVAVGAWFAGVPEDSWTKRATDGTPAEFRMKSM